MSTDCQLCADDPGHTVPRPYGPGTSHQPTEPDPGGQALFERFQPSNTLSEVVGQIVNRETGERLSVTRFLPGGEEPNRWANVGIAGVERVHNIRLAEWAYEPTDGER